MNIVDMVSVLEFLGISPNTLFPQLIMWVIMYLTITRSIVTSISESLRKIEVRLANIEVRLDHIEEYIQGMSLSMVEIQTIMKMKLSDVTFEHRIKPYKKLPKTHYTQI